MLMLVLINCSRSQGTFLKVCCLRSNAWLVGCMREAHAQIDRFRKVYRQSSNKANKRNAFLDALDLLVIPVGRVYTSVLLQARAARDYQRSITVAIVM